MQTRGCRLVKYQEMRLQEIASQVPIGHIPRSTTCHLLGELTRQCTPGDTITLNAVFLPIRNTGFRAVATGQIVADTYFLAMGLEQHKHDQETKPNREQQEFFQKFISGMC